MANILTPVSLWKDFDDSLETLPVTLGEKIEDGVRYEYVRFSGRDTGMGRVSIYGVVAFSESSPSNNGLLIMPDSDETVDEKVLKFFVERGYAPMMVDYRGKWEGCERYTVYPENVAYANLKECGRHKDFVDESADKTSWYEWVAVGIYARKFLIDRLYNNNVGVVGLRDGGEIAWKLATAAQFSCAVVVCACGWKAYSGYSKFSSVEPELNEERYRFLAGIDSQSYAPYVKCPILLLCSTNDPKFDYDRAYDTFSRINPDYAKDSVIAYSVKSSACIGLKSVKDMFMFLDGYVKQRHVFIPQPADISVYVDENYNLVARTIFDDRGDVDTFGLFLAQDSISSTLRDWRKAAYKMKITKREHEFYLDVYEKTSILFVLCYVVYSNGFTVWSKIAVKKLSGQFRNSKPRSNVIYSNSFGEDCFSLADCDNFAIGKIFLPDENVLPRVITKAKGLKGIYSVCGLSTYRLNTPQFRPEKDSVLRLDICPSENTTLDLEMKNVTTGEIYTTSRQIVGKVWQTIIIEPKQFKTANGVPLSSLTESLRFTLTAGGEYAVNNVIWL